MWLVAVPLTYLAALCIQAAADLGILCNDPG